MIKLLNILFLFITLKCLSFSHEVNEFSEANTLASLTNISVLEDSTNSLSFGDIIDSEDFVHSQASFLNFGVTNSSYWLKFSIKNNTTSPLLYLIVESPTIDHVVLYDSEGKFEKLGYDKPFSERKYNDPNNIFELDFTSSNLKTYFLKVKSDKQIIVPMSIGTKKNINHYIANNNLVFGLYLGVFLVMIIYNLFIFFSLKDKIYLYYVLYIILIMLTQIALKGFLFKYFLSTMPLLASNSIVLLPSFTGIAAIAFVIPFLKTKEHIPKLHIGLHILTALFAFSILIKFLGFDITSFQVMQNITMLTSLYLFIVAIITLVKGYKPANFFLIAWSVLIFGAFIFVLKDFGVLPYNQFTNNTLPIGSILEAVLLSFALADRINILKKEKENILEQQANTLKVKVKEATSDLQHTLSRLKNTQAQLVQNQKMVSIGQLAAGVAHEVNNPLNIINLSLNAISQDTQDLQDCVEILLPHAEQNIQDFVLEVKDYGVLKTEIRASLDTAQRSVNRTKNITENLKAFSQVDTSTTSVRLQRFELEIVLNIIRHQVGNISLVKHYIQAPFLECKVQALNELFYNVILNGIEAIRRKYGDLDSKGEIHITQDEKDGYIIFCVEDNGDGIEEANQSKIFEPFFTTKGVEGKGLGLYTVYHTIQELGGRVEVISTKDIGTSIYLFFLKPDIT